jgi:hypothetical protein
VAAFTPLHRATRESSSPTLRSLQIFVLFNGTKTTANALRAAAAFASDLGGDILIAAPLLVPYPLPLHCPSIDKRSLIAQIGHSVSQSGITLAVQKILIGYARDRESGWQTLLPHGCIVVLGKPNPLAPIQRIRTWLSGRSLRQLGYEVVIA